MDKKEMLSSMSSLKSKLMATISMLLVSAILLTNVSYAWFVLSTAPEVSGVSTTSGANGALEIALQSTDKNGDRAVITSGVGDSSASQPITEANKSWGNVVDIAQGYGLDAITLYPARLNVDAANNYKVNPLSYLSVPQYGTDGRIFELLNTEKTSYVETDGVGAFEDSIGYGVNVLGFQDTMEDTGAQTIISYFERETVRMEAVEKVEDYRATLLQRLTENAIGANSPGLFEMMVKLTTESYAQFYPWDEDDDATVDNIVGELTAITKESVYALQWALLAYAIADTDHYSPDDNAELVELGEIYKTFRSLPITADSGMSIRGIAEKNGYSSIVQAVDALLIVQEQVALANEASTAAEAGMHLVDVTRTFVMQGKEQHSATDAVYAYNGIPYDVKNGVTRDWMYMVNSTATTGNLFSMMAYILGDYQADIICYMHKTNGDIITSPAEDYLLCTIYLRATSAAGQNSIDTYDPETNVGTLQVVLDSAAQKATGQIPMSVTRSNVTAYGYSVDLAFRSSEKGRLILQQEPISRVYDGTNNQAVQGSGSTMTFQIFGNMTADQVARLLQSLYVVFMDTSTGQIYAVATADEVVTDLESVTTTLALHEVDYKAMEETGIIRIKQETIDDNVITTLEADTPKYITAVVFLNGDTVSSGDVSAQGKMSLIGSINMQFATDATLIAMQYDEYITRPVETTEPQTP